MREKVKRKAIPDRVKLIAALRRFGLSVADVQFDHNPALALRPINPHTGDTVPPANDPDHIDMLLLAEHKEKTFGRGREKRITTADGDVGKIAKMHRVSDSEENFRRRLLAKDTGDQPTRKSKWPSRPFSKQRRNLRDDDNGS